MNDFMSDLILVHRHLVGLTAEDAGGDGDAIRLAWDRLRLALLPPGGVASPPGRYGAVCDGVARLADHLHRMASEGQVARVDSVAVEKLLFRWVLVAENLTELLTKIWQGAPDAPSLNATACRVHGAGWIDVNGDCLRCVQEARERDGGGSLDVGDWLRGFEGEYDAVFAEHQVSYCDGCGAELRPDGCCVVCEHRDGGR